MNHNVIFDRLSSPALSFMPWPQLVIKREHRASLSVKWRQGAIQLPSEIPTGTQFKQFSRGVGDVELPKHVLNNLTRFQRKQKKGTIDVWWLYDDGGKCQ